MKYFVTYARIEHQIYRLEVEANNPDEAATIAVDVMDEFTGNEPFKVVHAEEFVNQIDQIEEVAT